MTAPFELDRHVATDDLPWVPQAEGVWFRPLRLSPERGVWANLLRVSPEGMVNRHRHDGAVDAWVIAGRWRYLEHDWVAGPGSYVHEPAGEVHTLRVEPGEEMVTLFLVRGPIHYLADDGSVLRTDTAQRKLDLYRAHCEANGLPLHDVVY